jgi:hypothetical protein
MPNCPFSNNNCDEKCSLFINPEDINENMLNKLASLGVIPRKGGICSFKVIAMSSARGVYENTYTNFSR